MPCLGLPTRSVDCLELNQLRSLRELSRTIQLNHEWTRMITNKNSIVPVTAVESPNGDRRTESESASFALHRSCEFVSIRGFLHESG
jgi:hypothetical protein